MSWQNVVLKALLRWRVKPQSSHSDDVEKVRATARRFSFHPKRSGWRGC